MTHPKYSYDELIAIAEAERLVTDAGFNPDRTYTAIKTKPGIGKVAVAISKECIPGSFEPEFEGSVAVRVSDSLPW